METTISETMTSYRYINCDSNYRTRRTQHSDRHSGPRWKAIISIKLYNLRSSSGNNENCWSIAASSSLNSWAARDVTNIKSPLIYLHSGLFQLSSGFIMKHGTLSFATNLSKNVVIKKRMGSYLIDNMNRFQGVHSPRCFHSENQAISTVQNGICNVGGLSSSWTWFRNHRLQKLFNNENRFLGNVAMSNNEFLKLKDLLWCILHSQVTATYNQTVRSFD